MTTITTIVTTTTITTTTTTTTTTTLIIIIIIIIIIIYTTYKYIYIDVVSMRLTDRQTDIQTGIQGKKKIQIRTNKMVETVEKDGRTYLGKGWKCMCLSVVEGT